MIKSTSTLLGAMAVAAISVSASADVFTNPAPIIIPAFGPAVPYASTVVANAGAIADVNVTLFGFSHTFPDDIAAIIVAPNGDASYLFSGPGDGTDAVGLTLTFDDEAASPLPIAGALASGSWQPSNQYNDIFGAPAPGGPYSNTLNVFDGDDAAGIWTLYVQDFVGGDAGGISGGFNIEITYVPAPGAMALLGLAGLVGSRRRRVA